MGSHPLNLALRFLLELVALAAITLLHYLISYDRIAWLLSR